MTERESGGAGDSERAAGRGTTLFLLPTDVMGGAENVLRMTAAAALAEGRFMRVLVFVLAGPNTGTLDVLERHGATIVRSGARSEKAGLPSLARIFARHRYALVFSSHTHLNAAASAARALGLLRTERLVARESTMAFERDLGRSGPLVRALYRLYGAQDRIVCQTDRMAESLSRHTSGRFAARTRHIPNPIDLDRCRSSNPDIRNDRNFRQGPFKIAWCGRLAPVKSPHRALETLALLRDAGYDARLTMIGDGPLRDALVAQADAGGIAHAVTFAGKVGRPADLMAACRLGLMTSDVEGFPNVILEMLAAGVHRVVTTDCAGGLAAIPGVTVSSSTNAAALAGALQDALEEPAHPEVPAYLAARSPASFLDAIVT